MEMEVWRGRKTGAYGSVHLDGDLASCLDLSEVLGGADLDVLSERGRSEGDEGDGELHCTGWRVRC